MSGQRAPERDAALWEAMADMRFWCEVCTGTHPLRDHKACREGRIAELIAKTRQAAA